MDEASIAILGSSGQLGQALFERYPNARHYSKHDIDIANASSIRAKDWVGIKVILNAAAYTSVDMAETTEGRKAAWRVNVEGAQNLVKLCADNDITLVHISSDYVFDGSESSHDENEVFSPINVYGETKAAADTIVKTLSKHYIIRSSWVIGSGKNFIKTMLDLAKSGESVEVVSDQVGRLTFTSEIVRAIDHILSKSLPYGTYNVTNDGTVTSWAVIAKKVFDKVNSAGKVTGINTTSYMKTHPSAAHRPLHNTLSLDKITGTGFNSTNWEDAFNQYLEKELTQ